jgi:hypothetical protein
MFAATGVTRVPSLRTINLERKLMVVMAGSLTSHKLVAIDGVIGGGRDSPLHRRGATHEIRQ